MSRTVTVLVLAVLSCGDRDGVRLPREYSERQADSSWPRRSTVPGIRFDQDLVKPSVLELPKARYPDSARDAGIEGMTVVTAVLDSNGAVIEAKVLKTSGNRLLDQAALDAARLARFSGPCRKSKRQSGVEVSIPYIFRLD